MATPGQKICVIGSKAGYSVGTCEFHELGSSAPIDVTLTLAETTGRVGFRGLRASLTWVKEDSDLDLHVVQAEKGTGRSCRVYYRNKNKDKSCCSGISLDRDVRRGRRRGRGNTGETVTWSDPRTYR